MKGPLGRRLVVASGNRHKVSELAAMLHEVDPDLDVVGLDAFDGVPEIEETADTFAGNAGLKARGIAAWLRERGEDPETRVLADDSGICVEALGGAPGVRSARFAGETATDAQNNAKLVEVLEGMGLDSSPAHYACVLSLVRVDGEPLGDGPSQDDETRELLFEGRWPVQVRVEARGSGGFGYDPHAWLDDGPSSSSKTVAELSMDEKATRSHRGHALRALVAWARGSG